MTNVRLHPFQGSDLYCDRCHLPKANDAHRPDTLTLVMVTYPDGTSEEFWTQDWDKDDLSVAVARLLDSAIQPRCDVCNVHTEEADGWCGNCGNCTAHCQQDEGCPPHDEEGD